MDREELDPDGAIEDQVADDTDDLGDRDPGDDPSDEAEKGRNHCSHPDPSRIFYSDGRCRFSFFCL
jgi:hypothetical protein